MSLNVSIFRRFKDAAVSTFAVNGNFKPGSFIMLLQSATGYFNTRITMEENIVLKSLFIAILYSFDYQWLCLDSLDLSGWIFIPNVNSTICVFLK